ncbi:co-chaperone DjlA [Planctobacterium marinum]|uniref:Co-chaperone protein DjlA n=1 Tax=Planctobacterium marinum TaxID=1631968 RepID=A0AA48KTI2_9ALTE|nr:co-chaperone protein DjlA [Planctobacterium marinum]
MNIWGKVLGTLFGAMFAKIPGAILGFIVGHLFDRGYSQDFNQMGGFGRFFVDKDAVKNQAVFFHALFSVLGHVAKADGRVTEAEIQVATQLMDDMNLTGDTRKEAQQAFREGKAADFPVKDILKEFYDSCYGRRDILQIYLEILIQAAYADGRLDPEEQKILLEVAQVLKFQKQELMYLISAFEAELRFRQASAQQAWQQEQARQQQEHRGPGWRPRSKAEQKRSREEREDTGQDDFDEEAYYKRQREQYSRKNYQQRGGYRGRQQSQSTYSYDDRVNDAYRILGVNANTDPKAIKKAYRKLMSEHHPDKLVSKGLPRQALDIAKQKAQDIQAAWELVKKEKGI